MRLEFNKVKYIQFFVTIALGKLVHVFEYIFSSVPGPNIP